MQPSANEIPVITYGVMEICEPDMESLGTEAQETETEASQPCKPIDSRIDHQWIPKHWKYTFGQNIRYT